MKNKKVKFGIGIGIILGVVGWEAVSGFQQSKTYYVTVSELLSGKVARHEHRHCAESTDEEIGTSNG